VPIPHEPGGKLKFFSTAIAGMAAGNACALLGGKRLLMAQIKPRGGDLEKITTLIEAGKIRPVIDKVFTLEQIAEAHRLSETGHVRGKLVMRVNSQQMAIGK
jgi:NADPH:quinone reductase-like Zn-dependent oxidoreductase